MKALYTGFLLMFALALFVSPILAQDLRKGLVAHWAFEEGSGDKVMDSVGENHGTVNGTAKWVPGVKGGGLEFDGTTNFVDCGADESLNITETLTTAAWIKVDIFGDWAGIVTKGTETSPYAMQMWSDAALRFSPNWGNPPGGVGGGSSFNTDTKMPRATWVHEAITYDGEKALFYIDGVPDALVVDRKMTLGTNAEPLILGCDFPGGDEYFDGVMDEVYIYSRALSQEEINKLMAEGVEVGGGQAIFDPSRSLITTWGMIRE